MIVNNLEGNSTSQIRFKGNIQLKNLDQPKGQNSYQPNLRYQAPPFQQKQQTKSAITGQLTIFRGPDEAVSDKQPGVSTYYELQQHAISAKFKCHDPRPQNAGGSASKHYESAIVGWVRKPSLIDNSISKGEC
ncbi:hypothetical protein CR513_28990, partial [Mucuna pruriens]